MQICPIVPPRPFIHLVFSETWLNEAGQPLPEPERQRACVSPRLDAVLLDQDARIVAGWRQVERLMEAPNEIIAALARAALDELCAQRETSLRVLADVLVAACIVEGTCRECLACRRARAGRIERALLGNARFGNLGTDVIGELVARLLGGDSESISHLQPVGSE